jgi:hypothetical protein
MPRPVDRPGCCNAWVQFGDDFGDNDCTFACGLPAQHEELYHEARFGGPGRSKLLRWEYDQRPDIETEDEHLRGYHDAHYEEPPSEPGEEYLTGYMLALAEIDEERAEAETARQAELDEIANDLDDVIWPQHGSLCRICQHDAALHRHQRGSCQAVVDSKPCGCTAFMFNDPHTC